MASKAIEVKGHVQRIVRVDGKAEAQMVVSIPVADSVDIPLGEVSLSILKVQGDLFEGTPRKGRGAA